MTLFLRLVSVEYMCIRELCHRLITLWLLACSVPLGNTRISSQLPSKFISMHYNDVVMTMMASQITSLTVVYSTVYSDAERKTSKLRVTGLCVGNSPGPVNSPHKWPITRKMFPFDDVIMGLVQGCNISSALVIKYCSLALTIDLCMMNNN